MYRLSQHFSGHFHTHTLYNDELSKILFLIKDFDLSQNHLMMKRNWNYIRIKVLFLRTLRILNRLINNAYVAVHSRKLRKIGPSQILNHCSVMLKIIFACFDVFMCNLR